MSLVGLQASKIWTIFSKTYCRAKFEIIFRQKSLPKVAFFGFCDCLLIILEVSRELRALIR